jgi:hypothetical protein
MKPNRLAWVAIALSSLSAPAFAERFVVLNGQRLSEPQIERLETLRCLPIPNGRYWLDWQTGVWGYEGDGRPQGRLDDPCRYPQQFRRPSLSERGKLFAPGELAR